MFLENDELKILDTHTKQQVCIRFNRTVRIPEDDNVYNLPKLFGQFPTVNVNGLQTLPEPIARKGGVIIPMLPREAVVITTGLTDVQAQSRRGAWEQTGNDPTQPTFAIRFLSGGVNVVSGKQEASGEQKDDQIWYDGDQDYIVAPTQERLDGFRHRSTPQRSRGFGVTQLTQTARQFVSMPTSEGYTLEEQVTGEAVLNGFQIIAAPRFAGGRGMFYTPRGHDTKDDTEDDTDNDCTAPHSLRLKPGAWVLALGRNNGLENFFEGDEYEKHECEDIRVLVAKSVSRFETRHFGIDKQLPDNDERAKTKRRLSTCGTDGSESIFSIYVGSLPNSSGAEKATNHLPLAMRHRRVSEALFLLATHLRPSSNLLRLDVEAVFKISIRLKLEPERGETRHVEETLTLSPFTTMDLLVVELLNRRYACCRTNIKVLLNMKDLPLTDTLFHHGCSDGSVLHIHTRNHFWNDCFGFGRPYRLEDFDPVFGGNTAGFQAGFLTGFPAGFEAMKPSPWELGVAVGGGIYQAIHKDYHPNQWNWKKSRQFSVQIMHSLAFKSFTGIDAHEPPISFAQYVDAGISFKEVFQTNTHINRDVPFNKAMSISRIDLWKGIHKDAAYTGQSPYLCSNCGMCLADTM